MATSGSTDLASSGLAIVKAAYRVVHNVTSAYTLEPDEIADGLEILNVLIKNLMGPPSFMCKGMKTWAKEKASLTLAAKLEFNLQSSGGDLDIAIPVEILSATYKRNNNEIPLGSMTYEEYFLIPNKTNTGSPTKYYYERRLDSGLFIINYVPTASMISDGDTIELSYLKPIEDFDSQANEPYFPQEWFRPLKWLLAQEWFPESGKALPQDVALLAGQSTELANKFDQQETNTFFEPNNPGNW